MQLFALSVYHTDPTARMVLHAMPVMLGVLLILAMAYRSVENSGIVQFESLTDCARPLTV